MVALDANAIILLLQARSSVGERFLDTEEVGGSIPPAPTTAYVVRAVPCLVSPRPYL